MDAGESRVTTFGVGVWAVASVAVFAAVYSPALASIEPGSGVRPWGALPLAAGLCGWAGWLPCVVAGACQLVARPRYYGLLSIGLGALQLIAFRLLEWELMGSRGLYWAP